MVASDVELLRKAVAENPYEDVPRLAFADALDERGNNDDAARAEFIRTQIAMHKLGPRRLEIHAIPIPRGDDYMEVVGSHPKVNVGDRVDVVSPYLARARGRGKPQRFWGWRVTKILPDDPALDTVRVALRRDEHSKPYPFREIKRLGLRCRELWVPFRVASWIDCPFPEPVNDDEIRHYVGRHPYTVWADDKPTVQVYHYTADFGDGEASWQFTRGFVSEIICSWSHWKLWGDWLVKYEPVTDVKLITSLWFDGTFPFSGLAGKDFDAKSWEVIRQNNPASAVRPDLWGELLSWRWPSIRPECWKLRGNHNEDY